MTARACWASSWLVDTNHIDLPPMGDLQTSVYNIFSDSYCNSKQSIHESFSIGFGNGDDCFCAGTPDFDGDGFADSNAGCMDGWLEGSLLICPNNGAATLQGLLNFSYGVCGEPGSVSEYTDLQKSVEWILETIDGEMPPQGYENIQPTMPSGITWM